MEQPAQQHQDQARRQRAVRQGEQLPPQRCPRCDSTNTKFCYFNNYSSSQPRYFCKTCRRYWTQGGTLRNVPHGGGGGRKGKRSKKASPSTSNSSASATIITTTTDCNPPQDLPIELQFEDNMDPSIAAAVSTMAFGSTSGSVACADAPPSTLYYGGGGMGAGAGVRTFTRSTMVGDVGGGLQAVVPPFEAQFLYGFHFPQTQQQQQGFHLPVNELPPQQQQFIPLNPNLMMMPQPAISQHGWHHHHQQQLFSAAPFASTISAAMPNAAAAPAAGASDVTDVYWSHVTSGRWDPDLTDRGPQPPSPPPF